ncbi:MAG TPA: hypothetical protein VF407_04830, partial [Polyangiaceae bacterium]
MRALFVGMVGFSALFTAAACSSGSSDSSPPPSGAESDAGAASDSAGFGDAAMPDAASHVDAGVDAALSFPNGESVGAGDDTACALGHGGVYCWRDDTNDGGLADTPALAVGTEKFVQFTTPPQIGYCAIDSTGAKSCSTLDLTSYDIAKFTSGISNQYCFLEHGGTVR